MITLATTETLAGVAGTAATVTYTISGDALTTTDAFKTLAQGQLAAAAATIYTAPASTSALISQIHLVNTAAATKTFSIFINGTASTNTIFSGVLPANGSATYDGTSWKVYDANGFQQYVGATGPTGATGTAATIAVGTTTTGIPGSSASVSNSGSSSAATFNFTIPAGAVIRNGTTVPSNGTGVDGDYYLRTTTGDLYVRAAGVYTIAVNLVGPTGPAGAVSSVTNSDGTITITGTGAAPVVSRAAITGDVAVNAASNTSTLATVNLNTGPFGSASSTNTITANGKGLITAITNNAIAITESQVTGLTTDLAAKFDKLNGVLTGVSGATYVNGKLVYDTDNDSLTFFNSDSAIGLQIGQEQWIRVKNSTGSTIVNGSAVYINGTDGANNMPTVALARADATATAQVIGMATEAITNGSIGMITIAGTIHGLNTSGFTAGVPLFLSASSAGSLTATAPAAPNYRVQIGNVLTSNASTGAVIVAPIGQPIGPSGVTTARLINTTAPLTGGGDLSADRTLAISAATTTTAGSLSANDKLKLDNDWTDAQTVGITPANSGATNSANWATWYAGAALDSTLYFAPGTYDFASELTNNRDIRVRYIGVGKGRSILRNTSTTANLINQTVAGFYISVEELGFSSSVTKTAGAAIVASSNNAYLDVRRCEFQNQFRSIDLSSGAANLGTINECLFTNPSSTTGGSQIRINGSGINMMFQNCTLNVTGVNTVGIEVNQCGAVQFSNCDFIGGSNTLLVNATATVSALYFNNVFFDQATFGSTVKFMGTGAVSRVKFVQCGITTGAAGLSALEIAGTGTGTGIPEAIDFELCDFYNAGFTGTTNGLLLTGVRGIDIRNCRISGFTNGVNLTPYNADFITNFNIAGNTIGPTENFAGNATGILVNAGAVKYGPSNISYNDLSGNTTAAITDNGNYGYSGMTQTTALQFVGNLGLAVAPKAEFPATLLPLNTVTRAGTGWTFLSNTLRIGTHLRVTVSLTCTGTLQILTPTFKFGNSGTNLDADLFASGALGSGTANVGSAIAVCNFMVLSSTTAMATMQVFNGNLGITGVTNAATQSRGSAGPITFTPGQTNILAPYFASSVASVVTIRNINYEVISQ